MTGKPVVGRGMLTIEPLGDLPGIRHAYFARTGGVSEGLFSSLNCGFGSGDAGENVAQNRARAMTLIDLDGGRLVTTYQVHSNRVAVVEAPWTQGDGPEVDALVTGEPGLALGILTADCAPVLLADAQARVIGAAHAGWQGALGGVLEAVVGAMVKLGARPGRLVAGIGPAIGPGSYEVGPEFPAPFLAKHPGDGEFFRPAPRDGHFHFDLKSYVAARLGRCGVAGVEALANDTCAEEAQFFSYRRACLRGESDYGRGLSAIYLEP